MRLKSMISWALIFSFTLLLFQPYFEARDIEYQKAEAKIAEINAKYAKIHDELTQNRLRLNKKAKAVTNSELLPNPNQSQTNPVATTSNDATTDSSSSTDSSADLSTADLDITKMKEAFVGINFEPKAFIGDYIPVTVVVVLRADIDVKVDKIDLSISDPKSNKDYFKDSFVNYKSQTRIIFTYNWDTVAAGTNPGDHTITVKVTSSNDPTGLFAKPVTAKINVQADPGIDIMSHGFWAGYLKQDGSLNDFWKGKLGCESGDDCKTRAQIRDHLSTAVADGDFDANTSGVYNINAQFNKAEEDDLDHTFTRYMHSLELNPPTDEEGKITASSYALTMSDLNNFIQDEMNTKLGIEPIELSEATATAPELNTALSVYNEYSVKIASYAPESLEDLKKAPFWGDMEKKIADNISQNVVDEIKSMDELNPDLVARAGASSLASGNILRPQKAEALFWLVIGAGFIVYDIYKLCQPGGVKDWKNWGMLVLDTLLLPVGGASLGEKLIVHVGSWLGKVIKVSETAKALVKWWETSRVGAWLVKTWEVAKWKAWQNPIARKIIEGVGEIASTSWVALSGWAKKAFTAIRGILRIGAQFALHMGPSECKGLKFLVNNGLDPFAWALCNITKFLYDLSTAIHRFAFCLLGNSIGAVTDVCKFKLE